MVEETTPALLPGGLPELPEEGAELAQLQEYQRELEARNEQVETTGCPALRLRYQIGVYAERLQGLDLVSLQCPPSSLSLHLSCLQPAPGCRARATLSSQ